MAFTRMDKRLVERSDLAFQEKYMKNSARHTPDAADQLEATEIEHNPISLYQKKMAGAAQAKSPAADTAAKKES